MTRWRDRQRAERREDLFQAAMGCAFVVGIIWLVLEVFARAASHGASGFLT
jgi:hypothetical protein